jgi:RNA polymerase primary sigma factor
MSESTPQDPIEEYFRSIEAVPPLTDDEERDLWPAMGLSSSASLASRFSWDRFKSGDDAGEAKRRVIEANLKLAVSIAHRYEGRGMILPDLVQEGNVGLIRAVELFDPSQAGRFASFASQKIEEAITHALG